MLTVCKSYVKLMLIPTIQGNTMADSIDTILNERNRAHGDYTTQATIAQDIKDTVRSGPNYNNLSPSHREALEMIAVKMARILSGNPNHQDHWDDIAGYARLASKRTDSLMPKVSIANQQISASLSEALKP